MAIKALLNSLDGIDDATKALYVEKDGKYLLDVEGVDGFALEDVGGLKNALGKERASREALEKASAKFKDLDPDKAREALAKLEELTSIDPAKEADKIAQAKVDAIAKQLTEKHAGELKERDEKTSRYYTQIEKLLIDSAATTALAEAKGSIELLLPHIRAATRVKEGDNGFTVEIVGQDGTPRISTAQGSTAPMTISELVGEMKQSEAFGRAFEASGASGSGKLPNQTTDSLSPKNLTGGAAVVAKMFPNLPAN